MIIRNYLTTITIAALLLSGVMAIPFILKGSGAQKGITNMGYPINTRGDDFAPSLTADGSIMVFNSREKGENNHNIYICFYENGLWSRPELIKELNSGFNEETPFISHDGSIILFSSDRPQSLKPPVTSDRAGRVTYDIFISTKRNGAWSRPEPVRGDINTTWNERSPALSRDGRTLYFCRWPYKNMEEAKIFSAVKTGDAFTGSTALPYPINTGNVELAFRESYTGRGCYFSSMRPGGYGGWDIYFVERDNGSFGAITNLGPHINTRDNELFYNDPAGRTYFSSNRSGSLGLYDIFGSTAAETPDKMTIYKDSVPLAGKKSPQELTLRAPEHKPAQPKKTAKTRIHFTVLDEKTGRPLQVRFRILLKDSADPARPPLRTIVRQSNNSGKFTVIPKKDVRILVVKPDSRKELFVKQVAVEPYRTKQVTLYVGNRRKAPAPLSQGRATLQDPTMTGRTVTSSMALQHILFDYNASDIRLEYYPFIHRLINHLRDNPSLRLLITGHADLMGSDYRNKELSTKRAMTVRDYLIRMGIDESRLQVKGMGSTQPLIREERRDFNEANRRVEFRFYRN